MLLIAATGSAAANTYTVTSISDDGSSTGITGTLRWALAQANADAAMDTINFDTVSMGGNTITVLAPLAATNPVTFDGGKTVVLGTTANTYGLLYFTNANSAGSLVKDIALIRSQYGIYASQRITVTGCNIGTDWSETAGLGNVNGIYLSGGTGTVIGAPGAANRNLIVANTQNGLAVVLATMAKIQNNYVGVLSDGKTRLYNAYGVYAWSGGFKNTLIGGNIDSGEGNVFSGNQSMAQIWLAGTSVGNTICGNVIGLGADQTTFVASSCGGLTLDNNCNYNWIGLPLAGYYNVIAGNNGTDVYLTGANNNIIQNNYIGINAAGNTGIANGSRGLYLNNSKYNMIGGRQQAGYLERNYIGGHSYVTVTLTGDRNTICGNWIGVDFTGNNPVKTGVSAHISIVGAGNLIGGPHYSGGDNWGNVIAGAAEQIQIANGSGNTVVGNYIGINAAGTALVSGENYGISFYNGSHHNLIGGSGPEWRNIISGNSKAGAYLWIGHSNTIADNYFNTTADGTALVATGGATCYGIQFQTAFGNLIGGASAQEANYICGPANGSGINFGSANAGGNTVIGNYIGLLPTGYAQASRLGQGIQNSVSAGNWFGLPNGGANNLITMANTGILISGASTNKNGIFGNTICGNSTAGILLSASGNNNMSAPSISTATSSAIGGTATANAYVEVFTAEAGTVGSALQLLGYTTADGSGNWSVTPSGYTTGDPVSALATDANNNTSKFGFYVPVNTPTVTPTSTGTSTPTPTSTATVEESPTSTPSPTASCTPIATDTATEAPTATPTPAFTFSTTPTITMSPTPTPTGSATAIVSTTPIATPTTAATLTATVTITHTQILTATRTATPSSTPNTAFTPAVAFTSTAVNPAQSLNKACVAYPNPAKNRVHFTWQETQGQRVRIVIYNLMGETVGVIRQDAPCQGVDWQVAGIAPGVYVYQIILTVDGVDQALPKYKLAIIR